MRLNKQANIIYIMSDDHAYQANLFGMESYREVQEELMGELQNLRKQYKDTTSLEIQAQ